MDNIHSRVLELTDRIIADMRSKKIEIVSPVEQIRERSAIISFTVDSETANQDCFKKLIANNIIVILRDGLIRVSPIIFQNPWTTSKPAVTVPPCSSPAWYDGFES